MRQLLLASAAILWLAGAGVSARDLTLREALLLAREHSLEVRQAAEEHQAAEEALGAARANRFPTFDATATAFHNTEIASFEVETPLGSFSRAVGTKDNYQADLRLSLPLYTGGRIAGGIDVAEAGYRRQAALAQAAEDEVLYRTRVEYLSVHRSDRQVEAARSALRRAEITREQVASLLAAGAADSVAVLEAELGVSEAEFRLRQAVHDRRAAEIRLAQLLGLPVGDSLVLVTEIPVPGAPNELEAPRPRPEVEAASAAADMSRGAVTQASSDWFPTLAAFGGYSYGKPNLDRFNSTWNDYWQIGARLEWSFNLGLGTKRQVNRAEALVRAAERRRDRLDEQFREQQLLAWENLALAFDQFQTARDRARITARNYELAQSQHSEGILSPNRLMEIEATLNEAEAALAAAEAGYHIARSAYLYAAGADLLTEGF